jgi:hypothetical protein
MIPWNLYSRGAILTQEAAAASSLVFCPDCGLIRDGCVCSARREHKPGCRFLRAASLSVELECHHGFQACPICDPCDCGAGATQGIL